MFERAFLEVLGLLGPLLVRERLGKRDRLVEGSESISIVASASKVLVACGVACSIERQHF